MAEKIVWSARATDDLHHIFQSLSIYADTRAERLIEEIIDTVFLLEQFPKMGRIVPEVDLENIREILVKQYRVVYVLTQQDHVEILTVRHSSFPRPSL